MPVGEDNAQGQKDKDFNLFRLCYSELWKSSDQISEEHQHFSEMGTLNKHLHESSALPKKIQLSHSMKELGIKIKLMGNLRQS